MASPTPMPPDNGVPASVTPHAAERSPSARTPWGEGPQVAVLLTAATEGKSFPGGETAFGQGKS